jgi:hypothetical protein
MASKARFLATNDKNLGLILPISVVENRARAGKVKTYQRLILANRLFQQRSPFPLYHIHMESID